jgi:uncharacterized membrane protein
MMKKKHFLIFLLFVIALGLIIYTGQKTDIYRKNHLAEKEALLIIDYGQDKERWFKGETKEGMTILDALTTSSLAGNFNFTANSHLIVLNGLANNERVKWRCYLNDREVKEDLGEKTIGPKDKILCRYQ